MYVGCVDFLGVGDGDCYEGWWFYFRWCRLFVLWYGCLEV